jgi:hypothetical protein
LNVKIVVVTSTELLKCRANFNGTVCSRMQTVPIRPFSHQRKQEG